jgi:hypothetical protein
MTVEKSLSGRGTNLSLCPLAVFRVASVVPSQGVFPESRFARAVMDEQGVPRAQAS